MVHGESIQHTYETMRCAGRDSCDPGLFFFFSFLIGVVALWQPNYDPYRHQKASHAIQGKASVDQLQGGPEPQGLSIDGCMGSGYAVAFASQMSPVVRLVFDAARAMDRESCRSVGWSVVERKALFRLVP